MTADSASSRGTPAATIAPKARTRISIVIGSDSVSAFLKSSLKAWSSALLALASPNWPTTTPGCWALTRSMAATTGSIAFDVWASSPRTSKVTSAERPSFETWSALPRA